MLAVLLNGATGIGAGPVVQNVNAAATVQLDYVGSVSGAFPQVFIEGSMDGSTWTTLSTMNVETTPQSSFSIIQGAWRFLRAEVIAVSPSGGTFTAYILD